MIELNMRNSKIQMSHFDSNTDFLFSKICYLKNKFYFDKATIADAQIKFHKTNCLPTIF